MNAPTKTLGQIAWCRANQQIRSEWLDHCWQQLPPSDKGKWESIAAVVALQCAQVCIDLAADHMRQAQGGDNTGASDYRQQAAIECLQAILDAISCGSKGAP